jgi:hypothetical protein
VGLLSSLSLGHQFTDTGATEGATLAMLGEALLGVKEAAVVALRLHSNSWR